jgi:hypothetical protein
MKISEVISPKVQKSTFSTSKNSLSANTLLPSSTHKRKFQDRLFTKLKTQFLKRIIAKKESQHRTMQIPSICKRFFKVKSKLTFSGEINSKNRFSQTYEFINQSEKRMKLNFN